MRRARYNYRKYLRYLRRAQRELWETYRLKLLLRGAEEEARRMRESESPKPERARREQVLEDWEDSFPW
jgi:hypothetical protein